MSRHEKPQRILDRARAPGFTPGRRDVAPLLDAMLGAEEDRDVRAAERALSRRGALSLGAALTRLGRIHGAGAEATRSRARLLRLVGRLAAPSTGELDEGGGRGDAADRVSAEARSSASSAMTAALADPEPRVRRQAALALSRATGDRGPRAPLPNGHARETEDALLAAWEAESDLSVRRALASALGQSGERALAALRAAPPSPDPELRRLIERAALTAARTLERGRASSIDVGAAPAGPLPVVLRCRAGLERLLAGEVAAAGWPTVAIGPGRVETVLDGPLSSLFQLRLHLGASFPLEARRGPARRAVVDALDSPEAAAVLGAFTRGATRFRLEWEHGGHRRADVWRIAGDVAARRPGLVNDPTDSTWRVHVGEDGSDVRVSLEPRKLDDPRFAYRVADVPASSHPTVAAALARLAVVHSGRPGDDVVWDPFVGSGLELIERARLAPVRGLFGTDVSPEALAAARANLESAGVDAALSLADATAEAPDGVTVILSNPPMGKRVLRGRAHALVEDMVERAAGLLPAGGLLCWISPVPGQTRARAAAVGLRLIEASSIDMGGFASEIQVFRREEVRARGSASRSRGKGAPTAVSRPKGGPRRGITVEPAAASRPAARKKQAANAAAKAGKVDDRAGGKGRRAKTRAQLQGHAKAAGARDRGPRPPAGSRGGARRSRPARSE